MIKMIAEKLKNLKLRQRMLLVYMIGCLLPIVILTLIIFISTRDTLTEQFVKEEYESVIFLKEEIEGYMDNVVELSDKLYFDPAEQKVGITPVGGGTDLLFGYRDFNELNKYVQIYYKGIASVCIYVNPNTISHVDNRNFRLITDTIKEKKWYRTTVERDGLPYWSYLTDYVTGRRSIRLTRILYARDDRTSVGIVSISLNAELTEDFIRQLNGFALMDLNGEEIVHTNFEMTSPEQVRMLSYSGLSREYLNFRDKDYVLMGIKITPRLSDDYYEILILRAMGDINTAVNGTAREAIFPILIVAVVMILTIFLLNSWFSKRIRALGTAMHKVTEGNFDTEDTGIGDTKDEIYDLYTDMSRMVADMQQLSEAAANERVQKEQIYSRQRDVEFKMLTTQINPHFLYNTLENIRMLAMINKEPEIEDISVRLTRLLRSSLEAGGELRTLEWEMDKVDCYIKIQDYRFGDRISAFIEYDKEMAKKVMIMPLIIQPYVENAYVHGMEEMEEGGMIRVRAVITDTLDLTIEDNGRGMNEAELAELHRNMNDVENLDRSHIGVANVDQRIKLKFGNDYGVTFSSREGEGTLVKIHLPLIPEEDLSRQKDSRPRLKTEEKNKENMEK